MAPKNPQPAASTKAKGQTTTSTTVTTTGGPAGPAGSPSGSRVATVGLQPPPQNPVPHADIPPDKQKVVDEFPVTSATAEDPTKIQAKVRAKAKPQSEYLASRPRDLAMGMVKALPPYIDDVTRDFGPDLYVRMMLDPQTCATVDIMRMAALYDPFRLSVHPNVPPEDQDAAQKITDFCAYNLDNTNTPFRQILYGLSSAIYLGHKLGEQIYRIDTVDEEAGPQVFLEDIHLKPYNSYAMVVDDKNNYLGNVSTVPGRYASTTFIPLDSNGQIPGLVPRSKFVVMVNDPEDGDPRGTSVLRPVYTEWWMKQQLKPEYLQFLATMAIPSIVGTLPEGAQRTPALDENNAPIPGVFVDPAVQMREALDELRNGGTMTIPFGALVALLQNGAINDGNVFTSAFDLFDRHIAKGVTKQTLATEQGVHMARAASVTHQDVLAIPIERITANIADTIRRDILTPLVLYNFGEDAARRLVPDVQSGKVDQQDFGIAAAGFAQLMAAGLIEPEQRAAVWEALGLPPVDQEVLDARAAEEAQAQADALAMAQQAIPGNVGAPAGPNGSGPGPSTKSKSPLGGPLSDKKPDSTPVPNKAANKAIPTSGLQAGGRSQKPKVQLTRAGRAR